MASILRSRFKITNKWKIGLLLVVLLFFITKCLNEDIPRYVNNTINDNRTVRSESNLDNSSIIPGSKKLILNWANIGKRAGAVVTPFEGDGLFSRCEEANCQMITDRSKLDVADAVMVRPILNQDSEDFVPHYRPNFDQVWIFFEQEPSVAKNIWRKYDIFDNLINATMTYRRDSDIFAPRIKIDKNIDDFRKSQIKRKIEFGKRNKTVAWFVSKCNTQSRREVYVRELSKHIDIDIYGGCGTMKCPKFSKECEDILAQNYKFYLSFENSICEDYVTEKLTRPLKTNTIPVVLGGANYSNLLPKGSYIDAKQYSPRELAHLLKKVAADKELYNSYLSESQWYAVNQNDYAHVDLCALCKYVNREKPIRKIYTNLTKWWMKCTSPVDYYKGIDIGPREDVHGFPSYFD